MTTTEQIITTFTEQVDTSKEYTRVELSKMLTEIYNNLNKGKKAKGNGEEKKKKEPSAYNLYLKEQMSVVKEEFPDLSGRELMKKIGKMWKEKKEKEKKVIAKVTEIWKNKEKSKEEVDDEVKEEEVKEVEEEVKEEEVKEAEEEVKEEEVKEEKNKKGRKPKNTKE